MSDTLDTNPERDPAGSAGTATAESPDALTLDQLEIGYRVRGNMQRIVRDVSLRVGRGESVGLVGESGCGKSTIALAIVRYLARNGRVTGGRIELDGRTCCHWMANSCGVCAPARSRWSIRSPAVR